MYQSSPRSVEFSKVAKRGAEDFKFPEDSHGQPLKVSQFFGENVFNVFNEPNIPDRIKEEVRQVSKTGQVLSHDSSQLIAMVVKDWAVEKGATHFCHWFQPLTGATAEKHDAFLEFDSEGKPIEYFSVSSLLNGEPDASSFPHGGSRSTFEARGYTAWDLTSPMFLIEGKQGKTLHIPTAFVSYTGEALDIKTPLLRSINRIDKQVTKFLEILGHETKGVQVTTGCEQEYFLIDKAIYNSRPDLIMTNRTVLGAPAPKNQQLSDHYFGSINDRVLAFMEELDCELYRLGIPSKTRHNEVSPGQFEIAPIFTEANIAADQNQILMDIVSTVADRHGFVSTLHEKPFAGVNGSGKHLNWSLQTTEGINLLEPGKEPHQNSRFLLVVATIVDAVYRHADVLRASIGSSGNDFRLGANEAPPSIISIFLGDTISKIFEALIENKSPCGEKGASLELGANQLVHLSKDNTDRNRTSPFAFTGNKFEFRAVGASAPVGYPLMVLNTAVASVFSEVNEQLDSFLAMGKGLSESLMEVTKTRLRDSYSVVFNGDGYSDEWVTEAYNRGLPNLKSTPEALDVFLDTDKTAFLKNLEVLSSNELETRYNVLVDQYSAEREIEFEVQKELVYQHVLPAVMSYKKELAESIKAHHEINVDHSVEKQLINVIDKNLNELNEKCQELERGLSTLPDKDNLRAKVIASEILPLSESIANFSNRLEQIVPDRNWTLPKFFEMLFLR